MPFRRPKSLPAKGTARKNGREAGKPNSRLPKKIVVHPNALSAMFMQRAGWKLHEIGRAFGVSVSSVEDWIARAKDEWALVVDEMPSLKLLTDRFQTMQVKALNVLDYHLTEQKTKAALDAAVSVLKSTGIVKDRSVIETPDLANREDSDLADAVVDIIHRELKRTN